MCLQNDNLQKANTSGLDFLVACIGLVDGGGGHDALCASSVLDVLLTDGYLVVLARNAHY
jgi:hypothetical protein